MKDTFSQIIRLGFMIVALACVLYWADATFFAPKRLPACVQAELPEGRVCFETLAAHGLDKIIWIDARSESDYELNHLMLSEARAFPIRKGAQFQQQVDAAINRLISAEERDELVVVFCSQDCTSSEEIAKELRALGIVSAPIYTLEGGWAALKASGKLVTE